MAPGSIILEMSAEVAARAVLDDEAAELIVAMEALAGGDGAAFRRADRLHRAVCARLAAALGPADETADGGVGLLAPPPLLDGRWRRALAWRLENGRLVAALIGAPRRACGVEIAQGPA